MKPSVGRIVHYVSYGTPGGEYTSQCRAAIVTEVAGHPDADDTVGLAVLNPEGNHFNRNVPHAEDKAAGASCHPGGTWHWPERESAAGEPQPAQAKPPTLTAETPERDRPLIPRPFGTLLVKSAGGGRGGDDAMVFVIFPNGGPIRRLTATEWARWDDVTIDHLIPVGPEHDPEFAALVAYDNAYRGVEPETPPASLSGK